MCVCVIINEEMRDFPLPYLIQRLRELGKGTFSNANWMRMVGFH